MVRKIKNIVRAVFPKYRPNRRQLSQWAQFFFILSAGSFMGFASVFWMPKSFPELSMLSTVFLFSGGTIFAAIGHVLEGGK